MDVRQHIKSIILEELSRSDKSDLLKDNDFKRRVKEITADVLEQFFKEMWTRKGMWKNSLK